ncbi:MAG: cbb3-type cytochrome oxidase subunit 3 [Aquincola tertiaricarbonis]|uniref:cbb3-type cytochrome oxidase subunit 3 n=1 Tax=Aquincola TaxID=391952 RepID=UPI0012ED115E|nr:MULTISPECIES: cbb3-type cytochrome c oxidase subunit 3 [Aquincola]MCR5863930.1 cbb3-type cytochrome c oxidase subunit 3 [Aquincola sp. J276]
MDINVLRSAVTLCGLVLFIALAVWVWLPTRRAALDEAALLPFNDDMHKEGRSS